MDAKDNIYGTTSRGGSGGYGTVFKLVRKPDGHWSEKILHNFSFDDPNGQEPFAGVTLDSVGNLYGTTVGGGTGEGGTIFEMIHGPTGWGFQVLYDFCSQPNCTDGGSPWAGVVFDKNGNLFGTAFNVFELTPGDGGWTESVLYNFCAQAGCSDGRVPYQGVILDRKGNLYGVTQRGGSHDVGVVYKLRPMPDGTWKQAVLHRFGEPGDGSVPGSAMVLAMDDSSALYGTTEDGGRNRCGEVGCGTIFRLARQPSGRWKQSILHNFKPGKGGNGPTGGVVLDAAGNLYGTAAGGGDSACQCGVVYKLGRNGDGSWSYSVLHRFIGSDGYGPGTNLVFDDQGNLYGTTIYGGPYGGGVVFELTP